MESDTTGQLNNEGYMVLVGNEYSWAVVLNWTILPPGDISKVQRHLWLSQGHVTCGISSVEARDAAKLPTVQRTVLTTKKDPAPNVNDVQAESPF